jgi:hypothetical protein
MSFPVGSTRATEEGKAKVVGERLYGFPSVVASVPLACIGDVAAGQLAVFQGANEAPISGFIRVERATGKTANRPRPGIPTVLFSALQGQWRYSLVTDTLWHYTFSTKVLFYRHCFR